MTTHSHTTRVRHDSDATFREWGAEFSASLAAIGLTQTADTGQINWTTVTRPGVSTEAGYEIWRFNDTAQATSPIYIRFGYGTHTSTTDPRIQVTVGSGTNGAGVITATGSFTINSIMNGSAQTTDVLRTSYFCYVAGATGFLGLAWKTVAGCRGSLFIGRTCDSSGVADTDGAFVMLYGSNLLSAAYMNFVGTDTITTKVTSVSTLSLCHWPSNPTASLVGSDQQVACAYYPTPRFRPFPWIVGCLNTEFPIGNTFTATMVGSTARTYLALANDEAFMNAQSSLKTAMIWE